jgi:hypothetical protein
MEGLITKETKLEDKLYTLFDICCIIFVNFLAF